MGSSATERIVIDITSVYDGQGLKTARADIAEMGNTSEKAHAQTASSAEGAVATETSLAAATSKAAQEHEGLALSARHTADSFVRLTNAAVSTGGSIDGASRAMGMFVQETAAATGISMAMVGQLAALSVLLIEFAGVAEKAWDALKAEPELGKVSPEMEKHIEGLRTEAAISTDLAAARVKLGALEADQVRLENENYAEWLLHANKRAEVERAEADTRATINALLEREQQLQHGDEASKSMASSLANETTAATDRLSKTPEEADVARLQRTQRTLDDEIDALVVSDERKRQLHVAAARETEAEIAIVRKTAADQRLSLEEETQRSIDQLGMNSQNAAIAQINRKRDRDLAAAGPSESDGGTNSADASHHSDVQKAAEAAELKRVDQQAEANQRDIAASAATDKAKADASIATANTAEAQKEQIRARYRAMEAADAAEAQDRAARRVATNQAADAQIAVIHKQANDGLEELNRQWTATALDSIAQVNSSEEDAAIEKVNRQLRADKDEIAASAAADDVKGRASTAAEEAATNQIALIRRRARDKEAEEAKRATDEAATQQKDLQGRLADTIASTIEASVKGNDALSQVLTKSMLSPIEAYLHALGLKLSADAAADLAAGDFIGAAAYAAAAGLVFASQAEVGQLGGGGSGGGNSSGSSGGPAAGSGGTGNSLLSAQPASQGGNVTLVVQTVDPTSQAVINNTLYQLNRAGVLSRPVYAPALGKGGYPNVVGS